MALQCGSRAFQAARIPALEAGRRIHVFPSASKAHFFLQTRTFNNSFDAPSIVPAAAEVEASGAGKGKAKPFMKINQREKEGEIEIDIYNRGLKGRGNERAFRVHEGIGGNRIVSGLSWYKLQFIFPYN